jgi:hypothetical protein
MASPVTRLNCYTGFCDSAIYRAVDFAKNREREFRRFELEAAAFIKPI